MTTAVDVTSAVLWISSPLAARQGYRPGHRGRRRSCRFSRTAPYALLPALNGRVSALKGN
ncbi:MAG: hypothetical protein ACRDOH_21285 [Streptosporangiaceae bacterium]